MFGNLKECSFSFFWGESFPPSVSNATKTKQIGNEWTYIERRLAACTASSNIVLHPSGIPSLSQMTSPMPHSTIFLQKSKREKNEARKSVQSEFFPTCRKVEC